MCFACSGMVYATTQGLPFGNKIDTAYVSKNIHIELKYSVLNQFDKINLFVSTSMDGQNRKTPQTLSGVSGTYKRRIPVDLSQEQITEIIILLQGDGFTNRGDSANYPFF